MKIIRAISGKAEEREMQSTYSLMKTRPDQSGLVQLHFQFIMHLARSTNMERFANMAICEEVDQDDRRNDHTEQNCPDVVNAKQ